MHCDDCKKFNKVVRRRLTELELAILEIRMTPYDLKPIERALRVLGEMKQESEMFGVEDVVSFAGELEQFFEAFSTSQRKIRAIQPPPFFRATAGVAVSAKDHH